MTSSSLSHRQKSAGGFALVIALSLMAFVLLLVVSMMTIVQVESSSARSKEFRMLAEQSALLGLKVALGDLQKAAGPDQRITSTADISASSADGNKQWVGVWDTSSVDRFDPSNTRQFVKWMVSTPPSIDATATDLADSTVQNDGSSGIRIFDGVDENGATDPARSVNAPLVPVDSNSMKESAYAYWIEDEGVKAKLSWNESTDREDAISTNLGADALQRSRLTVPPGVDFGRIGGSFESELNYPMADASNDAILSKLRKITSYPQLANFESGDGATWLNLNRHDFTVYGHGVLADVKNGGLKQDLTLAFEMDDDEHSPNLTNKFNSTVGDFVGSGDRSIDRKSAIYKVGDRPEPAPFFARYIFSENQQTDDTLGNNVIRGATWHLLRDYYNFYKRVRSSSGGSGYEFDIQPFYPNQSEINSRSDLRLFDQHHWLANEDTYGKELNFHGGSIIKYMPTRGSYTPVLLGYRLAFSLKIVDWVVTDPVTGSGEGKLALAFDPFFYLWNPYDQSLRFENLKINYSKGIPLLFEINVDLDGDGTVDNSFIPTNNFSDYIEHNFPGLANFNTYLKNDGPSQDIVMAPGEVLVFSSQQAGATTRSVPGPQLDDTSGFILPEHPTGPIELTDQSRIDVSIKMDGGSRITTRMYHVDHSDYVDSVSDSREPYTVDAVSFFVIHTGKPVAEGATWNIDSISTFSDISVSSDFSISSGTSNKVSLGYFDILLKGTKENGDGTTHVAPFAHFNPTAVSSELNYNFVPANRFGYFKTEPSFNSMIPNTIGDDGRSFWGEDYSSSSNVTSVPVREIPTSPLLSIADFSSADAGFFIFNPVRLIGASHASPLIPRDQFHYSPGNQHKFTYDSAWLANDGLWDGYFFSGIVPGYSIGATGYARAGDMASSLNDFLSDDPASNHLNSRLKPYVEFTSVSDAVNELDPATTPLGYKKLARYALMDGAFNVNSTSIDAWAALLGANRGLNLERGGLDVSPSGDKAPFPKSAQPLANDTETWTGYGSMDADEIEEFAEEIVQQVKMRGPFMSLSDFVNRRLEDSPLGESGVIQAAIDSISINTSVASAAGTNLVYPSNSLFPNSGTDLGNSAQDIGGFTMQADILRSIGPVLSARSDTFRITSYGESKDPVSGQVASARCEAVVQRVPEYVDTSDSPDVLPKDLTEETNEKFGRRFKIVSFNWIDG